MLCLYTFHATNPWPVLRGQIAGSILVTTVLMVAISRRQMWARYALIVFVWYTIVLFGGSILVVLQDPQAMARKPLAAGLAGVAIYLAANIVLTRSRKIEYLAHAGSINT